MAPKMSAVVLLAVLLAAAQSVHFAVRLVEGRYEVAEITEFTDPHLLADSVADIKYSPSTSQASNFGIMQINTSSIFPDNIQAYSAGYAEGSAIPELIYNQFQNMQC